MQRPQMLYRTAVLMLALSLQACAQASIYPYKEPAMPESTKLNPRLQALFAKTKLVCFGRYALEVPQEAQLIWGGSSFPAEIDIFQGDTDAVQKRIVADIIKIKSGYSGKTAEIIYNQVGPMKDSWQIQFYKDGYRKERSALSSRTYIAQGGFNYIFPAVTKRAPGTTATAIPLANTERLRQRAPDENPAEPGYCMDHAFIPDKLYSDQEMISVGIYFPSLPDINFSVSSNKDAYADLPPAAYEKQKTELSLLARIEHAKKIQGMSYPSRTVLREGKRDVQHWHGEESLIKRKDGVHDFEWALVGTPKDVANPSEFSTKMYSKVEHGTVGAAHAASLSDEEAVALWDKLLSGLKFRVAVPGAPAGSYFTHPDQTLTP